MSRDVGREDHGDLIVLHLAGTYREMGRQHVELLGPLAREVYETQRSEWAQLIATFGRGARMASRALPWFWMRLWRRCTPSSSLEGIQGMADALGEPPAEVWKAVVGSLATAGSTSFAATRSATADGGALIGRNADLSDGYGLRRPVVSYYRPENSDLAHIGAAWALFPGPVAGVNEAGLALAGNAFGVGRMFPLLPSTPGVLQSARCLDEAISVFRRQRASALFATMADAGGNIAVVEYAPAGCGVFTPDGDWLAQANHARTAQMIPHDRARFPDSFARLQALESALRKREGEITPAVAAELIRYRPSRYCNDAGTIGGPEVLNAAVLQPSTRTLWHSTTMQPLAPFGEFRPFSLQDGDLPALPADPRLVGEGLGLEADVIARVRGALRSEAAGNLFEARAIFDRLVEAAEPVLDPHRLAWARARVRWSLGELEEADALLSELDADEVSFDVRAWALVMRALIADRSGRREAALAHSRRADAILATGEDYGAMFLDPMQTALAALRHGAQPDAPLPPTPHLQGIPK